MICKVEAVDLQLEIFTSYTHVFKLKFLFLIYDDNGLKSLVTLDGVRLLNEGETFSQFMEGGRR